MQNEERINGLETQVRTLKRIVYGFGCLLAAGVVVSATTLQTVPKLIQAEQLQIVNEDGKIVVRLGYWDSTGTGVVITYDDNESEIFSTDWKTNNTSTSPSTDKPEENDSDFSTDEFFHVSASNKRWKKIGYEEFIFCDFVFTPKKLTKPTRAVKGALVFCDLFGEEYLRIGSTITETLKPNTPFVESGTGFGYNDFKDSHNWVRHTDLKDMIISFEIDSIIYEDGTKKAF